MSGSNAKHIRVAVRALDGERLGHMWRQPHNANWRTLGKHPNVTLTKKRGAQWCMWSNEGCEWYLVLSQGETPPSDLEAP